MQGDRQLAGVARLVLVDGVVEQFEDQVVQAVGAGGADVHRRVAAYRFEPGEDHDRRCVVGGGRGRPQIIGHYGLP